MLIDQRLRLLFAVIFASSGQSPASHLLSTAHPGSSPDRTMMVGNAWNGLRVSKQVFCCLG